MEAGVPHVVCCRGRVFDGACKTFTKASLTRAINLS